VDSRRDQGGPDLIGNAAFSQETPVLSIVIPVYNEGENVVPTLRGVVEKTHTRPLEVLVVHDFDEDTTVPVVKRLQAEMPELRLHRNTLGRGVLNAMKSGLRAARAPYVLVTMGDGSDNPEDIDPMYQLARQGADVVAGSRYMKGGRQLGGPLLKRTMSRGAGLSLHWLRGAGRCSSGRCHAARDFRFTGSAACPCTTRRATSGFTRSGCSTRSPSSQRAVSSSASS